MTLDVVARDASIGAVTSLSTASGLAPISVVIIITYGRFMSGSKSAFIRIIATTPITITATTATNTVYGLRTLNFDIIFFSVKYFSYNNIHNPKQNKNCKVAP